jgi:hypothetical protein
MERISFETITSATMQATGSQTSATKPQLSVSELATPNNGASIALVIFSGKHVKSQKHSPNTHAVILVARISDLDGSRCWSLRYDDRETPVSVLLFVVATSLIMNNRLCSRSIPIATANIGRLYQRIKFKVCMASYASCTHVY